MTTKYTTRDEAIQREIVEPIEASVLGINARDEYDIESIANAVLGDYEAGYACQVSSDEFWAIVEAAAYEQWQETGCMEAHQGYCATDCGIVATKLVYVQDKPWQVQVHVTDWEGKPVVRMYGEYLGRDSSRWLSFQDTQDWPKCQQLLPRKQWPREVDTGQRTGEHDCDQDLRSILDQAIWRLEETLADMSE